MLRSNGRAMYIYLFAFYSAQIHVQHTRPVLKLSLQKIIQITDSGIRSVIDVREILIHENGVLNIEWNFFSIIINESAPAFCASYQKLDILGFDTFHSA